MTDDRPTPRAPGSEPPASTPDLDHYVAGFGTAFVAATERAADAEAQVAASMIGARRSSSRRWPFRLGRRRIAAVGTTMVVAAVAGVVLLPLTPAPKPFAINIDVVAEARAALGERGEIVHYVVRSGSRLAESGPSLCKPTRVEVWQATVDGPRWRRVQPGMDRKCGVMSRGDGTELRGEEQFERTPTRTVEYYPDLRRVFVTTDLPAAGPTAANGLPVIDGPEAYQGADIVSALRRMLQDGYLRSAGSEQYDGRTVFRLRGVTRTTSGTGSRKVTSEARLDYLVEPSTFEPIELVTSRESDFLRLNPKAAAGRTESVTVTTFLRYETLPRTPENEKLLEIQPLGDVKTQTTTAAQFEADAKARMKRENAKGHALAERMNAERKRREAAAKK